MNIRRKLACIFGTIAIGLSFSFALNNYSDTSAQVVKAEENNNSSRCGVEAEWHEWTSTTDMPTSGSYYLSEDIEITSKTYNLTDNLNLDLNGKTITFIGSVSNSAITINNGFDFLLCDSVGTGSIRKDSSAVYYRAIIVCSTNSIFTMKSGTIEGFKNSNQNGGAIYLQYGIFNLENGTIKNCAGKQGGGIYADSGATFNMLGGYITECSSSDSGGGVYVRNNFAMSGGYIFENTANGVGGGVCKSDTTGLATLSNGEIHSNTTNGLGGGGIVSLNSGKINITGNIYIFNNISTGNGNPGGGLYARYGTANIINISGGRFGPNLTVSSSNCGFGIFPNDNSYNQILINNGRFYTYPDQSDHNYGYNPRLKDKTSEIIFEKLDGTGGTNSLTQTWKYDLPNVSIPSKEGHSFLGYFNAQTGGDKYFNADGTPVIREEEGTLWDYVGPTTLYAHWSDETSTRSGVTAGWIEWTHNDSLPLSGYFYLSDDVTITTNQIALDIGDLHLDLNGHTINFAYTGSNSQSAFILNDGNDFYLYDSSLDSSGAITTTTSKYLRAVNIENAHSAFYMHGGTISNFKNTTVYGGAVIINEGLFEMYGGTITGCSAINGGAVYANSNSTFNFYGGTISNSSSKGSEAETGNGGGVYGVATSSILIDGGTITTNNADRYGGGVFTTGYLEMQSGIISDCNAKNSAGGGVMLDTSTSNFVMSGGTISNNKAPISGGGVRLGNGSLFTMTGGEISGNSATLDASESGNGGGVFVKENSTFIMEGGLISGNTAKRYGGGVNIYGTFEMKGGSITNNTSQTKSGGGVAAMVSGASFTMTGGEISENVASVYGGGVCLWSNASATFNGGRIKENTSSSYSGIYRNATSCPVAYTFGRFYTYPNQSDHNYGYNPSLKDKTSEIIFEKLDGTGGTNSLTQTWKYDLPNVSVPSKEGHTFLGYFNDQGEQYYNADGTAFNKPGDGIKWDYVGPVTLTAKWAINEYTVSYVGNKPETVTGDVSDIPEDYVASYNEEFNLGSAPSLQYFTFEGWYEEAECINKVGNAGDTVINLSTESEMVYLYAGWIKTINNFASEFLDKTSNRIYCEGSLDDSIKQDLFASFDMVDSDGKTTFKNAEWIHGHSQIYENDIVEAKSRYCYMVVELGINDFLNLFTEEELKVLMHRGSIVSLLNDGEDGTSIILVASLSILTITTLSAYILFRKRKEE